jgi:urease accessory protein
MTEPAALQKLLTWLSPAFPVGAFAWSAGLESAIADRTVSDSAALQNWLEGVIAHGGLKTDAILLAQAWKAEQAAMPSPAGEAGRGDTTLSDLADLAVALTPALERHAETTTTGDSFTAAAKAWPSEIYARLPRPCPYPIAVGAIARAHGVALEDTLLAFLTAAVHGQISVAVRLVPLGQTDGLKVMAALEPRVAALARTAATATLADLGAIAYATDIAQMRHETLEPRIFRS